MHLELSTGNSINKELKATWDKFTYKIIFLTKILHSVTHLPGLLAHSPGPDFRLMIITTLDVDPKVEIFFHICSRRNDSQNLPVSIVVLALRRAASTHFRLN